MYKVACQKELVFRSTPSASKSLTIPSGFTDLIKVAKFLKAEFNARRAIYKMTMEDEKSKSGKKIYEGIDFVRDAGTDKLLKSIRREFLHLSAYNSISMRATGNNRRVIIEG